MKNILLSLFTIGVLGVTLTSATAAWFTSGVTAADNEITTGTLMMAMDSTQSHTYTYTGGWVLPTAYNIARDLDGVMQDMADFEPWTNAEPGVAAAYDGTWPRPAGNFSVWVTVRNRGTLAFDYQGYATGAWTNTPRIDAGVPGCVEVDPNDNLVVVDNVHRYAATPTSGCENHEECQNLRDALIGLGTWTPASVTAEDVSSPSVITGEDLGPNEFVVYRVDMHLSTDANNCYQGATYEYDLVGQAKQLDAPNWTE